MFSKTLIVNDYSLVCHNFGSTSDSLKF